MDIEKRIGNFLKKWTKNSQSKFDNWLIKKIGNTKIDNVEEWCTLQLLSLTYYTFYMVSHIGVDKEYNARTTLEGLNEIFAFFSKMPLCKEGWVEKWFIECQQLKEEIENNLSQFLLHPEKKELYTNTISKMKFYCERHKEDYEEWNIELKKYQEAEKKELLLALSIAIGIGIGILCSSMMWDRQQSMEQNETEIIEEQKNVDETSLEEIEVEQILSRKL